MRCAGDVISDMVRGVLVKWRPRLIITSAMLELPTMQGSEVGAYLLFSVKFSTIASHTLTVVGAGNCFDCRQLDISNYSRLHASD